MVTIRSRFEVALSGKTSREQRELLALRNRFLNAITERMKESRRVIRYVFRDYPAIVKKAGSDYARSAKRRARRVNDVSDVSEIEDNESVDVEEVTGVPAGTVG